MKSSASNKLMVCLDECTSVWANVVSSYGSFCTSFHVVTYGAFFEFISLFLWYIRCVWYIRRKKFFLCYIGRCLNFNIVWAVFNTKYKYDLLNGIMHSKYWLWHVFPPLLQLRSLASKLLNVLNSCRILHD